MRKEIVFGGLSNSQDQSVEPNDKAWLCMNTQTDRGVLQALQSYGQIGARTNSSTSDVGYGLGYGKWSGNDVQKLRVTGAPTGGTFTLEYDGPASGAELNQVTANINWNATANDVQVALEDLAGLAPGDVFVSGGPFPGTPMLVEFTGTVANSDMRILVAADALTGGSSPAVEVSTIRSGGDHEVMYAVVKHSGDTDANLYAVTSSDGFATTTWTSLATDFHASDWYFQQYEDKMFMANATDGLKYVYIGSSTVSVDPPNAPTRKPTFGGPFYDDSYSIGWNSGTYANSGFTAGPTVSAFGNGVKILLAGTESGNSVTVTATLASDQDWSDNDWFYHNFICYGGLKIELGSIQFQLINADGSPATISPAAYQVRQEFQGVNETQYFVECQFAGITRYLRDNVDKIRVTFTIAFGENADYITLYGQSGSNWPNDSLALAAEPTKDKSEYAMSYYRVSDDAESKLSPIGNGYEVPAQRSGNYQTVNGYGSQELGASDLQWFYRKEKSTGKWRRLPNITTKQITELQLTDYGVTNDPTGASDGHADHWMEYELEQFPEPQNIGFPPTDTGAKAEVIAAWKQSLIVGSGKLAYLSWVGQPLRFEPSPDQANYVAPDPDEFPDVGATEYVSDNRAENVYGFAGQDSLYAVTNLAMYAKVGDTPAEATVFRRLPGSRGSLGKRAHTRYGGGITVASQDGLWYYSVGRGFSGEDNGALAEREETKDVRLSYDRLLSTLMTLKYTGTVTGGNYTLSINGEVAPQIAYDATPVDIQTALENTVGVAPGDVEVWSVYDPVAGGTVYIRFVGQYAGTSGPTLAADSGGLEGDGVGISIETLTSGGGSGVIVREHEDNYWIFNQYSYLFQSRNRTWQEGVFSHSVKDAIVARELGLFFLTTTGRLMRIKEGLTPPGCTDPRWYYESPWTIGQRLQVTGIKSFVQGVPRVRVYLDDGANGITYKDYEPGKSLRFTELAAVSKPGVRVKLVASGRNRLDAIKKLALEVEAMPGDEYGS